MIVKHSIAIEDYSISIGVALRCNSVKTEESLHFDEVQEHIQQDHEGPAEKPQLEKEGWKIRVETPARSVDSSAKNSRNANPVDATVCHSHTLPPSRTSTHNLYLLMAG